MKCTNDSLQGSSTLRASGDALSTKTPTVGAIEPRACKLSSMRCTGICVRQVAPSNASSHGNAVFALHPDAACIAKCRVREFKPLEVAAGNSFALLDERFVWRVRQ